jgi:hypothetical protein
MEAQIAQFANRGMNQDISVSKASNEFAFRNYNIRITAVNDNTLLSVTNEKLPADLVVNVKDKKRANKISLTEETIDNLGTFKKFVSEHPTESDVIISYRSGKGVNEIIINKGNKTSSVLNASDIDFFTIKSPTLDNTYYYYTEYERLEDFSVYLNTIEGSYLGHAILNDTLVLFTHTDEKDYIWKFEYKDGELNGKILYGGQLGFDLNYPIETLTYYENKDVQKVYWVDGINQPRYINIVKDSYESGYDFQFDFNPKVYYFPEVEITKNHSGGMFPSGVIQYFISYYTKYGAETGIVWASDLQYLSNSDKANSPDQTTDCSFTFKIKNLNSDSNFYDHIRLYSIYRTSKDGEVVAQIVKDFNITGKKEIEITDNNTHNSIIDPTMLFYLGGDNFIASTFAQKDNTLFLGNIKTTNTTLHTDVEKLLRVGTSDGTYYTAPFVFFEEKEIGNISNEHKEEYQLNNSESTFKTSMASI